MARPLRIEYPGAWYHVMNRGRRRERIFQDGNDYQAFIDLLRSTSEMFHADVSAFCLMPNHYHLLIHTPEGNLTRCMRHIGGVYTQHFNRRHAHEGQLFRGRYKAVLVEEEEYLLGLVRYIHFNPIKAGLVEDLKEYPWTSHHGYLSPDDKWDWLYREPVLTKFADDPVKARKAYRLYMAQGGDEEIERVFALKKLPAILGSGGFIRKIKGRFFDSKKDREVPEAKGLAPSVREIKAAVSAASGAKEEEFFNSARGITNEPRNVAVYLVRTLRGDTLPEIAVNFGIRTYSTVSSTIARVKSQLAEDPAFRKRVDQIKESLTKSHRERQ
jgi:putative transposase